MLNQSVITGRLTKEPVLRFSPENKTPVVSFTVAVDRDHVDENGERKTDFIPVVAWNSLARFVTNYFGKGGSISVVGRLQSKSWQDHEGKKHYAVELLANNIYFSGDSKKIAADSDQEEFSDVEECDSMEGAAGADGAVSTERENAAKTAEKARKAGSKAGK